MKVLDQLAGIKAASGDPVLHLGLLLGALLMPMHALCNNKNYG